MACKILGAKLTYWNSVDVMILENDHSPEVYFIKSSRLGIIVQVDIEICTESNGTVWHLAFFSRNLKSYSFKTSSASSRRGKDDGGGKRMCVCVWVWVGACAILLVTTACRSDQAQTVVVIVGSGGGEKDQEEDAERSHCEAKENENEKEEAGRLFPLV